MEGKRSIGEDGGPVYHGGDLVAARQRFPHAREPWIDLSTGINARPYPLPVLSDDSWTRLPARADILELEVAAAQFFGTADPAMVTACPGTQAILQWLPHVVPARSVGILGFTYQEHGHVWRAAGAKEVRVVERWQDLAEFDVAVVVNPNNPDGRFVRPEDLTALAAAMAERGGTLVVDEAFMDLLDASCSLVPRLPDNAIVLRSFGKTWGLAGLRLGFAVAGAECTARFRAAMGPWAVSGPAVEIGRRAYADRDWLQATRAQLAADAARLDALLAGAGFEIVGGTTLYRLARHDQAGAWFERLAAAGILTRPFPAKPCWLRFGLPAAGTDWARLARALTVDAA